VRSLSGFNTLKGGHMQIESKQLALGLAFGFPIGVGLAGILNLLSGNTAIGILGIAISLVSIPGIYGTIELVKINDNLTSFIVSVLQKEYEDTD
jgi:hypothetical protein